MKRIGTALVLIPVFAYVVLWAPQWFFLAADIAVALACFYEFSNLAGAHAIARPGLFGYAAGVLLILLPQRDIGFVALIALLAMALSMRSRDLAHALPYAGALFVGVIYVFGALRCAAELRAISPYWAFFALSVNWVGDIFALYVGRAIGRHKLAPRVSPGKSWEGAIASAVSSLLYAALYFPKLLPQVPLAEAFAVALAGNVAGQIGDLCESALKRGAGVKDSGQVLPGHGGWLDRVDSSLFALPTIYFIVENLRLG
jgi:phosphatidate cytidylyltransferase